MTEAIHWSSHDILHSVALLFVATKIGLIKDQDAVMDIWRQAYHTLVVQEMIQEVNGGNHEWQKT